MVLAAGSATRFGSAKQLVVVDGLPLVAHAVRAAHDAGLAAVLLVVGHAAAAVADAARRGGPIEEVVNPGHAEGQSTSLRAGLEAATATSAEVAVVLLADQPGIDPAVIRRVVEAVTGSAGAARVRYDDGWGHPVALARRSWARLVGVTGDRGARDLLTELDLVEVAVDGPTPTDVDVPGDLPAASEPGDLREAPPDRG